MPSRITQWFKQGISAARFCTSFVPDYWANKKTPPETQRFHAVFFKKAEDTGLEPAAPYGVPQFQ